MRIGVDLGGTKIEAVALDGSELLARRRVPTPRSSRACRRRTARPATAAGSTTWRWLKRRSELIKAYLQAGIT